MKGQRPSGAQKDDRARLKAQKAELKRVIRRARSEARKREQENNQEQVNP
jgi:hypothetical protein